jgi:hypothetical protein
MGFNDRYRIPKDGWKINAVSARIGARWVAIPFRDQDNPVSSRRPNADLFTFTPYVERHVDRTLKSHPH